MARLNIPDIAGGLSSSLSTFVNSVKNSLQSEANEALHFAGDWTSVLDVKAHDVVAYGGALWEALLDSVNSAPAVGSNWRLLRGGLTRTVTTTQTLTVNDEVIFADATGGAVTLTLPAAADARHKVFIKRINSGANAVTVQRAGSDTIDGGTSKAHSAQWESYIYTSNGSTTWGVF